MGVLGRNYDDVPVVPNVPRDPAWTGFYVRRGESLCGAIQRQLREGVTVGLRRGDDGRTYAELRLCDEHNFRGLEIASMRIRLPAAVDRAVREREPTGSFDGLRFVVAIPHQYLFPWHGCWK